jgi:hypothetical protein
VQGGGAGGAGGRGVVASSPTLLRKISGCSVTGGGEGGEGGESVGEEEEWAGGLRFVGAGGGEGEGDDKIFELERDGRRMGERARRVSAVGKGACQGGGKGGGGGLRGRVSRMSNVVVKVRNSVK